MGAIKKSNFEQKPTKFKHVKNMTEKKNNNKIIKQQSNKKMGVLFAFRSSGLNKSGFRCSHCALEKTVCKDIGFG